VSGPPQGPVEFDVVVVPNARRTEAAGCHDGALRVRLQAQPIEGRANAALVEWVAEALGVARRGVEVRRGETSRRKRLRVQAPAQQVSDWLARAGSPEPGD
jgi:uncharacterized protein (TIGR00251 family)